MATPERASRIPDKRSIDLPAVGVQESHANWARSEVS
jgi:hypothetical protein